MISSHIFGGRGGEGRQAPWTGGGDSRPEAAQAVARRASRSSVAATRRGKTNQVRARSRVGLWRSGKIAEMPSVDPGLAAKAAVVLLVPVWRCTQQLWYRLCYRCALRKFRELGPRVEGLREQEAVGPVNSAARGAVATDLEALSVFPPALRGLRGEDHLSKELTYLHACITASEDYLSLPVARKTFSADSPLRNLDHLKDVLGEVYDHLKRKR